MQEKRFDFQRGSRGEEQQAEGFFLRGRSNGGRCQPAQKNGLICYVEAMEKSVSFQRRSNGGKCNPIQKDGFITSGVATEKWVICNVEATAKGDGNNGLFPMKKQWKEMQTPAKKRFDLLRRSNGQNGLFATQKQWQAAMEQNGLISNVGAMGKNANPPQKNGFYFDAEAMGNK